jgi:hypothetical protein
MGYVTGADGVGFRMHPSHEPIGISADARTFRSLDAHWGADKARVFYDGVAVADADPESFRALDAYFGCDSRHAYYRTRRVEGADVESFEALAFEFARAKDRVYLGASVIAGADPQTFRALDERYATDAKHVFLDGYVLASVDPAEFGVWGDYRRMAGSCFFRDREIQGADAATFGGLGGDYAKDTARVYFRGEEFANADLATFESLGRAIARDAKAHYVGMRSFEPPILPGWEDEPLESLQLRLRCRAGDPDAMIELTKWLLEEGDDFEAYVWSLVAVDHARAPKAAKRVLGLARRAADPHQEIPEVHAEAEAEAARRLSDGREIPANQEAASKHRVRARPRG